MPDTNITSADSVVAITIPGLFDTPIILSGYSAERAWNSDAQDIAELQMGVDGRQTAGYVPNPVRQTFSFQADSPSKVIFQTLARAMKVAKTIYYINATITLPGPKEVYTGVRGVLQNIKAIPDAAKVLQPVDYIIQWESLDGTVL